MTNSLPSLGLALLLLTPSPGPVSWLVLTLLCVHTPAVGGHLPPPQMKERGQTGHIPPVTGQGFPGQQSPQEEQQMGSLS